MEIKPCVNAILKWFLRCFGECIFLTLFGYRNIKKERLLNEMRTSIVNPLSHLDENIHIIHEEQTNEEFFFIIEVDSSSAICPSCQKPSYRSHSRYSRHVDDLPISDRYVHFQVFLYKWFCDESDCSVTVFTERLSWLQPYKRKTNRLEKVIEKVAFSTNCLTAEKVCLALHIPVSHDTLLRRVKAVTIDKKGSPFRRD